MWGDTHLSHSVLYLRRCFPNNLQQQNQWDAFLLREIQDLLGGQQLRWVHSVLPSPLRTFFDLGIRVLSHVARFRLWFVFLLVVPYHTNVVACPATEQQTMIFTQLGTATTVHSHNNSITLSPTITTENKTNDVSNNSWRQQQLVTTTTVSATHPTPPPSSRGQCGWALGGQGVRLTL